MNKTNLITLIFLSAVLSSCYQQKSSSPVRSGENPSTSATAATEPKNQIPAKGNYETAISYFGEGKYEAAAAELEEVVKSEPDNYQAYFYLGKSYQASNKTDKAVEAYTKAIDTKTNYAEANFELGSLYRNKKDYESASSYLEKAARIKYTTVEYLLVLGDNYRDLKRCEYAIVPYGKVPGFDAKNTAALYGMGLCYIQLNNRIAAAQQVRNLEQLDKNLAKKLFDQIPK